MTFIDESRLVFDKSLTPEENLRNNIDYLVRVIDMNKDLDIRVKEINWKDIELDKNNIEFSKKYYIVLTEFYTRYFNYLVDSIEGMNEKNIEFMFSVSYEYMNCSDEDSE